MEDKTQYFPVFESGQPAEMPAIEERFEEVEAALCSTPKLGEKVVRKAVISLLQHKADDFGGNGLVELVTSYGKNKDIQADCPFGVAVRDTVVRFAD